MNSVIQVNRRKMRLLQDLNTATVLLSKGTGLWARAIQKATSSVYSSAAMVIDGIIYEMDCGTYTQRPIMTYGIDYDLFVVQGMTEEKTKVCLDWWLRRKDAPPTSFTKGLAIIESYLGMSPLHRSKTAFSSSESVWSCLRAVELFLKKEDPIIYPGDISWDPLVFGPLGP